MDKDECIAAIKQHCKLHKSQQWCEEKPAEQTGEYMRQLGVLYMSEASTEKMNFVYSAGLLAAAKVRAEKYAPKQVEVIENDLQKLWLLVLKGAQADSLDSSLKSISHEVRCEVEAMRDTTEVLLQTIPTVCEMSSTEEKKRIEEEKIVSMQDLLSHVAEYFIAIMRLISDRCSQILFSNTPPCEFAHVALSSLARREVTPFSDFENMILLNDVDESPDISEAILEKFRWYAVAFQVVLISLGESPLRLLGIPVLNDFSVNNQRNDWFFDGITKCGLQFDSNEPFAGVHPLGHRSSEANPKDVELIKTVSQMANLLEVEFSNVKSRNEADALSHLAIVLVKSEFVAGNKEIHEKYQMKVKKILNQKSETILSQITKLMKQFDSLNALCSFEKRLNIKELIYRSPSLLITNIGSMLNINNNTCFGIIQEMMNAGRLSTEAGHNLNYVVAVSNEIRMKLYQDAGEQVPAVDMQREEDGQEERLLLVDTVGITSILDFFDIIRCLWISLHPVIWKKKNVFDENSVQCKMRNGSEAARIIIRAALHISPDKETQQATMSLDFPKASASSNFLDCIPLGKLAVKMLICNFCKMIEMLQDYQIRYQEQDKVDDIETIMQKSRALKAAMVTCQNGFHDVNDFSLFNNLNKIQTCFFGESKGVYASPLVDAYVDTLKLLQETISPFIKDKRIVALVPELMHVVYRVYDFTTALRSFCDYCIEEINTESGDTQVNITEMFASLDEISIKMLCFKEELHKTFSNLTSTAEAPPLIVKLVEDGFDDGLFDLDTLMWGMMRLSKIVERTRHHMLPLLTKLDEVETVIEEKLEKAVENTSLVARIISSIQDWSFILKAYSRVLQRDAALMIGDIVRGKAKHYYSLGEFEIAMVLYDEEKAILENNFRDKNYHKRKVAEAMGQIAKCKMRLGDYTSALVILQNQQCSLDKVGHLNQKAENLENQAECFTNLQDFASAEDCRTQACISRLQ